MLYTLGQGKHLLFQEKISGWNQFLKIKKILYFFLIKIKYLTSNFLDIKLKFVDFNV